MIYNIFISHSWSYFDQYDRLVEMLNKGSIDYRNYSVPKDDPIHHTNNNTQLKEAIRKQMKPASCVLIMAGVYSSYSKWINIEIDLAREMCKPIIAIEPWGSERTSSVVKNSADYVVGWNTNSIVDAIKKSQKQ